MSNMWQTPTLLPETVRLALVQQFFEKTGRIPSTADMAEIKKLVKYIVTGEY